MKQRQTPSAAHLLGALCLAALLPLTTASATDLSQIPLYTTNSVPPNIFFLNDDSKSMDGETMIADTNNQGRLAKEDEGVSSSYYSNVDGIESLKNTVTHPGDCTFTPPAYADPEIYADSYAFILDIDDTTGKNKTTGSSTCYKTQSIDDVAAEEEWRVRFYETNRLYYDPKNKYLPWPGNNPNNGNAPFANMEINEAWIEPAVSNANKQTIDLTEDSAVLRNGKRDYYEDGKWETWCHDYSIDSAAETKCNRGGWRYYYRDTPTGPIKLKWVKDLTGDERTNFANWFTYHRSRKNVAKSAIGKAVEKAAGNRLGYGAINDIVEGATSDIATIAASNSSTVLSKLYNTFANGHTPLQKALDWVGKYYEIGETGDAGNSPILSSAEGGACQLNTTVLMTDGFYTDADDFSANDSSAVGNTDGGTSNTAFDGPPYADNHENTLADIAMHYYERDLASGVNGRENKVPTGVPNVYLHQHMDTYTIAFGLKGDITNTDTANINATDWQWPDPDTSTPYDRSASIPARIDDLFHAAINGRGKYINASTPGALEDAFSNIVSSIAGPSSSSNTVATSAFHLDPTQKVITTGFDSTHWSGTVKALNVNADGTLVETPAAWSSDTKLPFDLSTRNIITYNDDTETGIPFQWGSLTSTQQTSLRNGSEDNDDYATLRLDYLRGQNVTDPNTTDSTTFRERDVPLGDIINSSPTYVGIPSMLYPDADPFGSGSGDNRYSDFWTAQKDRIPMVYVGANDGMLHGFQMSDGTELLAYVPNAIFSSLKDITLPTFDSAHKYFVDQTPTVADVYINNNWSTVLVSGLGAGGQGLFALNITDPSTFSETSASTIAMWEFSDEDDRRNDPAETNKKSDLGYTLAKPAVVMTESEKWVVISGNGYDSESGRAALFIFDLAANPSATTRWRRDTDPSDGLSVSTDYIKIMAGEETGNALFSPAAVDSDGNGKVDHVYAGDLKGNLWVFDLRDNVSWSARKLFSAGTTQPITVKPTVIRHPTQPTNDANKPNMLVLFGTGRYLSQTDLSNSDQQGFYAVWDDGGSNRTLADLTAQTLTAGHDAALNINARVTEDINIDYSGVNGTKKYGWYIDLYNPDAASSETLPPPSERVVTNATVYQGIVLFTTYIHSADPCESGGKSWFMFLKDDNGGPPNQPIISINNDRTIDNNDVVTLQDTTITNKTPSGLEIDGAFGLRLTQDSVIISTTKNGDATNNFAHNLGATSNLGKRLSWRELRRE
jgi:type IV pilus assembly protein PilY1